MDALSQGQSMLLEASGLAVGLPDGLMGNSEVGHYTIGTGRVSYQDIVSINRTLEEKTLGSKLNLAGAFHHVKQGNGRLHLLAW